MFIEDSDASLHFGVEGRGKVELPGAAALWHPDDSDQAEAWARNRGFRGTLIHAKQGIFSGALIATDAGWSADPDSGGSVLVFGGQRVNVTHLGHQVQPGERAFEIGRSTIGGGDVLGGGSPALTIAEFVGDGEFPWDLAPSVRSGDELSPSA